MTTIAASPSQVTIAAANSTRNKLIVFNQSDSNLYTSTVSGFLKKNSAMVIPPQSGFIYPMRYVGAIYGVWDDSNGQAQVTEV